MWAIFFHQGSHLSCKWQVPLLKLRNTFVCFKYVLVIPGCRKLSTNSWKFNAQWTVWQLVGFISNMWFYGWLIGFGLVRFGLAWLGCCFVCLSVFDYVCVHVFLLLFPFIYLFFLVTFLKLSCRWVIKITYLVSTTTTAPTSPFNYCFFQYI